MTLHRWLAALLIMAWPLAAPAETVVVTADRMVDVVAGRVVEAPVVVIADGRIVAVATRGDAPPAVPEGARRIDLPGYTLLPGLIDLHVHLDGNAYYGGYRRLQFTDHFWTAQGVANARTMLEAGFTTIRSMGARNYADVALRQAFDEGLIAAPRIVPAGNSLGATGGHCDNNLLPPSYGARGAGVGDGPQELIRLVREQRRYGAEVIKICATGGVMSRNTDPGQQQLSEAEMRAVVEEARRLGLRVAAHAHGTEGIKAAIRAGVDTIEHASLIDDEGIALARRHDTWLVMDIFLTDWLLAEGERIGLLPVNLDKERQVGQAQRESFRRALRGGARMAFGTDASVYPHGMGGGQFAVMVRYGMTPMQAIQSATLHAAEALNRTADVGAIAPGRFGDLVAVAGDPIADVGLLANVAVVIQGGAVVSDRRP
jgi:imidazolonepropionase-like amidohydrolase